MLCHCYENDKRINTVSKFLISYYRKLGHYNPNEIANVRLFEFCGNKHFAIIEFIVGASADIIP